MASVTRLDVSTRTLTLDDGTTLDPRRRADRERRPPAAPGRARRRTARRLHAALPSRCRGARAGGCGGAARRRGGRELHRHGGRGQPGQARPRGDRGGPGRRAVRDDPRRGRRPRRAGLPRRARHALRPRSRRDAPRRAKGPCAPSSSTTVRCSTPTSWSSASASSRSPASSRAWSATATAACRWTSSSPWRPASGRPATWLATAIPTAAPTCASSTGGSPNSTAARQRGPWPAEASPSPGVPFFWTQHFDLELGYAGAGRGWEEVVVLGDIGELDFTAFYATGDRLLAACGTQRKELGAFVELMRLGQLAVRRRAARPSAGRSCRATLGQRGRDTYPCSARVSHRRHPREHLSAPLRSASRASPLIHQIIARAARRSAHHQPKRRLSNRPTSNVADM